MNIFVEVSKDAILDEFYGSDEKAEQSCENYAQELKEELGYQFDAVVDVEITEHTDKEYINGVCPSIDLYLVLNDIREEVWKRFEWVVE